MNLFTHLCWTIERCPFYKNYVKLYFDAKLLEKGLNMGKWGGGIIFWGPFFHKKCPFVNNMNDLLDKHASLKKKKQ